MPKVLNKHRDILPPDAVYCGRGSKWGNKWSHIDSRSATYKVATREEAVECHRKDFLADEAKQQMAKKELRGKDLVCFCKPLACHCDIYLEVANA